MSGGGAQDVRGQDKTAAGIAGSVNQLKMRLQEGEHRISPSVVSATRLLFDLKFQPPLGVHGG